MALPVSSQTIAVSLKKHVYDICLIEEVLAYFPIFINHPMNLYSPLFLSNLLYTQLEAYVTEQVNSSTYDFIANKTLLKLYSFYPERRNDKITSLILTKVYIIIL